MISDNTTVGLIGFFGVVITAMCKVIPKRMNVDYVRKELYEQRVKAVDDKHAEISKSIDKLFDLVEKNNEVTQKIAQDVAVLVDRRKTPRDKK